MMSFWIMLDDFVATDELPGGNAVPDEV